MQHAALVGVVHRPRHGRHQPCRLARPIAISRQIGRQAGSLNALHTEVIVAFVLADFVYRHDVRMVEPGDRFGLVAEPPPLDLAGELAGGDHLQGDHAVKAVLASLVNDPHAPLAENSQQLVIAEVANSHAGVGRRCPILQRSRAIRSGIHLRSSKACLLEAESQGIRRRGGVVRSSER